MQDRLFDGAPKASLLSADPATWPVHPGWQSLLDGFWGESTGQGLRAFLQARLDAGATVYPWHPLRALALLAPDDVRVVILGQDPYHGPGQAEGLAFSVAPGVRIPPSLRNIFLELQRDLGVSAPLDGSLVRWAQQGVLLLNTCLTVEDGLPASHAGKGWEELTDRVVRHCLSGGRPKALLLWGGHAQKKVASLDVRRHLLLCANHPSPLSARRGPMPFLGCGHFSAVKRWHKESGAAAVDW